MFTVDYDIRYDSHKFKNVYNAKTLLLLMNYLLLFYYISIDRIM